MRFLSFLLINLLLSVLSKNNPTDPVPISVNGNSKEITILSGDFKTTIAMESWKLKTVERSTSKVILEETDEKTKLSVSIWQGKDYPVYLGYLFRTGKIIEKYEATKVDSWKHHLDNTVEIIVSTTNPSLKIQVKLFDFRRRQFSFKAQIPGKNTPLKEPRVFMTQGFKTPNEEGFYGLGERFNTHNHRGHVIEAWVEGKGIKLNIQRRRMVWWCLVA
jgi:hypothetical protein